MMFFLIFCIAMEFFAVLSLYLENREYCKEIENLRAAKYKMMCETRLREVKPGEPKKRIT